MIFSLLSSLRLGSRRGRPLAVLFFMLAVGCFSDPKIDPTQTRHCKDEKSCPWGSVCGPDGLCCESVDGKTCKGALAGLDATALDSQASYDIAIRETGLGTGDTTGLDSGQGTGGALGWDGSIDMAADSPLDAPQMTPPEAGAGGVPGTGGVPSTGGASGAGGELPIDAPKTDALDGTGGSGTGGGSGGSGGTGAPGQTCQSSATCASGLSCSPDGYCCDLTCTGPCQSCETGACKPVTGTPHTGHTSCAGTSSDCSGSCAGATDGQCTWVTTACGQASCTTLTNAQSQPTGTTLVPQGSCSAGACVPGTTTACTGNLVCASATACRSSCASDADCLTGNACSGGVCIGKKANGNACNGTNECQNGNCVDGVCCESTCTGTCMACSMAKTGAADGYCRAATAGTNPHNDCAADTTACGHDGTCDGVGACRYQGTSVSCGAVSCTGQGTYTPLGHCNGGGTCLGGTAGPCPGNMPCASITACATTCTPLSTTGCPTGYKCTASGTNCVLATMTCAGSTCPIANGGGECCGITTSPSSSVYAEVCISPGGTTCAQSSARTYHAEMQCHSKTDCPSGQICCLLIGSVDLGWSTKCSLPTDFQCQSGSMSSADQVCDPALSPTECSSGSCTGAPLANYGFPDVLTCQ